MKVEIDPIGISIGCGPAIRLHTLRLQIHDPALRDSERGIEIELRGAIVDQRSIRYLDYQQHVFSTGHSGCRFARTWIENRKIRLRLGMWRQPHRVLDRHYAEIPHAEHEQPGAQPI